MKFLVCCCIWCLNLNLDIVPVLYIDLRPGQTCHSKDGGSCIFHWPVMGRDSVGELGWQYRTGLKSHGTVTNWCTGRGWPGNCMTVISARWWSKHAIPKTAEVAYSVGPLWKEIDWVSNYYITRCTGSSISWWEDAGLRNMSQRGWAPRSPVEQPRRTGKKHGYGQ